MSERAKAHMGGGKPNKKSEASGDKPHEMSIRRAHGGGFIVKHHHKPKPDGSVPESTDHVVPDADQLQQHVQDNMGDQPPAGTPAPDSAAQAAPAQGAPTPQGM